MIKRLLKKLYKKIYKVNNFTSSIMINDLINNFSFKKLLINLKGFKEETWNIDGINNRNYKEYLSDREYMNMHPINGRYSMWIDDKLTLKYMLAGNPKLRNIMPDYYWHIDEEGNIFELMDLEKENLLSNNQEERIIELLKRKKELAFKLFSGSIGKGFYKVSYIEDKIYINSRSYTEEKTKDFIRNLRGYLITEFIKPNKCFTKYCTKTTNTIRYLVGKENGKVLLLFSYIRFGTKQSDFIENYDSGGVLCILDKFGDFKEGNLKEGNLKNKRIRKHPDTNKNLKDKIPNFYLMREIAEEIFSYLPQLKYCGIDFVYTNKNEYKILEINSLTSLAGIQLEKSILKSEYGNFYLERLKK